MAASRVELIAYFQNRVAPVENGLRVFSVYRACGIGLIAQHNYSAPYEDIKLKGR